GATAGAWNRAYSPGPPLLSAIPPTYVMGFVCDHMLSSAVIAKTMKNQFGKRGNAPRGMRPISSSSATTPATTATIAHVGEIDTMSASAAATSSFVPAQRRWIGDFPG